MITAEHSRVRAEEAERLAEIVSYGRDKERLLAQAAEFRRMADIEDAAAEPSPPTAKHSTLLGRMRTWANSRHR